MKRTKGFAPGPVHRLFAGADEAVSPVISTILMVAITVVLAATAFVLVADVGGQTGKAAPAIGLRADDNLDRLVVTSAAQGADWARLAIMQTSFGGTGTIYVGTSATDGDGYQNEPAAPTGPNNIATEVAISTETEPITAGQYLELCRSAGGNDGALTVTIKDVSANALIGSFTFLSVDPTGC